MFSIVTVASSTRIPTAKARPPRVIRLMVSPSANMIRMEDSTDNGIDTAMITVLRQLPRNNKIIKAVKAAAMRASCITPLMAALTKRDWSNKGVMVRSAGSDLAAAGNISRRDLTMSKVDAPPFFKTEISTPR